MEKQYREITFMVGHNIESAVKELNGYKEKGELVCGSFNGHKLYSDIDDIESAYVKITGKTKSECDAELKQHHDEYVKHEEEHKNAIPTLTQEWIEKGKKVLDEKYLEYWTKIVPIRLSDLYHGMELGACLEIVTELNKGCDLDVAKKIIEDQGHSGMSHSLVCSMIRSFCDRGNAFVNYIK